MTEFLYGTDIDDEYLHDSEDDAIEHYVAWADRAGVPITGTLYRHTICPAGVTPEGSIPDGAAIISDIVEDFGDTCGFEELYDNYDAAAEMPDVIAAFQAARDLLVSKQKYRIADRLEATASFTITAIDDDGVPTYTIGEWEPA